MVDKSRRDMIKQIAKGAIYTAPVVYTMAAPARLMAGPSGGMEFCDHFPVLCMIFGNPTAGDPIAPPGFDPATGTLLPPPPGSPPPGATTVPGGRSRKRLR